MYDIILSFEIWFLTSAFWKSGAKFFDNHNLIYNSMDLSRIKDFVTAQMEDVNWSSGQKKGISNF